jgi:hypothetical protein
MMSFAFYTFVAILIGLGMLGDALAMVSTLVGVTAIFFALPLWGFGAVPWSTIFVSVEAVVFAAAAIRSLFAGK